MISAFRRKVQISPESLHIVVEGKRHDSSYYGKIAESSKFIKERGYVVTRISNIYTAGGKCGILKVFEYLKTRSQLVQVTSQGKRVVVFALDNDAEVVVGGSKRNPHVFYTHGYDVESDIVANGADELALAAATSLSPSDARNLCSDLGDWRGEMATEFRDWIELCCISKRLGLQCSATYGRDQVPVRELGRVSQILSNARQSCPAGVTEFDRVRALISLRIERLFRTGRGDTLLKGKWLPSHLKVMISRIRSPNDLDFRNLEARLVACFVASLDPSDSWSARYIEAWEALIA